MFDEYSWILIGRIFAFANSSVFFFCRTIFGVQKASLNMFWEYSPSSTNLVSDWLRAESSSVDEEEIKMDHSVDTLLASEGTDLFLDLLEAQPCL